MKKTLLTFTLWTLLALIIIPGMLSYADSSLKYQRPPEIIAKLVEATDAPMVMASPDGKTIIIAARPLLKSLADVAEPELKLAGIRINPKTNGRSRGYYYNEIKFKNLRTKKEYAIKGLPEPYKVNRMVWSPNGKKLALLLARENGIEIWSVTVADGTAQQLTGPVVNQILERKPLEWLPDSSGLIFMSVSRAKGATPPKEHLPEGPVIQSSEGKKAPVATYRDLLKTAYDGELFTYYTTAQLMKVIPGKKPEPLGKPGIIRDFSVSPNGKYIYLETIKEPFSYLVPYYYFPHTIEILDASGNRVKKLADIPLAENVLNMMDAVRKGPISHEWRADAPATLYWVEALDEGNPKKKAKYRDRVYYLEAPFNTEPKKGPDLEYRLRYFDWGNGKTAFIHTFWWKNRRVKSVMFQPDNPTKPVKLISDRSFEDRYNDPGYFVSVMNKQGKNVLLMSKNKRYLYLRGRGASPEGNRPFIDRFDLKTLKTKRLWRSKAPYYEYPYEILNIRKKLVLTRREGKKVQPNYFIRNLKSGKLKQVTFFPHPYKAVKDVEVQLIKFKRSDGIDLTGKLYLPPGYKTSDGPLPTILWAYPREFKSRRGAGQVSASPYQFMRLHYGSVIPFITQGYAVFDRVSMPILGEGKQEPNDTFVKQLKDNAKSAIDKLVEMKVTDPKRVAIGGHSYGAFMTANLLAHSRLFAAGIARSGAYNRSLTPFGFQNEERTFWEAPEIYFKMSPFMHVHKIKDPILLIHGQMDNNSGTFPMQSERFFHALKGHSAKARLVVLPYESHGYSSRENIMHMLWETYQWLEKYVKNKK